MTTTNNVSAGVQSLLALVESGLIIAAAGPVETFLQQIKTNPNPVALAAYLTQLEGSLIGALPGLESGTLGEVATLLSAKVAALLATAEAAQAPAAAPAT